MVNSKLEAEVQSVCEAGFDSYLASKHREHLVEGMETGLLGAFIGTLLTIGASYVDPNKIIKPQHAWMPASIGFMGAVAASYLSRTRNDDAHKQDFEKVCESVEE